MGGTTDYGKISFFHGNTYSEEEFLQIGLSFIPLECLLDNGDSYVFIIWNLKPEERFRFMHPKFSKGASGALLFFDLSDYSSFKDLENWIKIIKDSAGDIPIILFGIISDLEHQMVTKEEVYEFLELNCLDSVYFSSKNTEDNVQKKKTVFKRFIRKIAPDSKSINDFYISFPLEDEEFKEFVEIFSVCPICKEENHIINLKNLFFSTDPNLEKTKNALLDLIEDITNLHTYYSYNISFGIPCCNCFKKLDF